MDRGPKGNEEHILRQDYIARKAGAAEDYDSQLSEAELAKLNEERRRLGLPPLEAAQEEQTVPDAFPHTDTFQGASGPQIDREACTIDSGGVPQEPRVDIPDFIKRRRSPPMRGRQRVAKKSRKGVPPKEPISPEGTGHGCSRRIFLGLGIVGIAAGIAEIVRLKEEYETASTPEELNKTKEENEQHLIAAKIAALTPDAKTLALFEKRRTDPSCAFRKGEHGEDVKYFQRILQVLKDNGKLQAPSWWTEDKKRKFETLHVRATSIFDADTLMAASALAQQHGLFIESRKGVTGVLTIEKALSLLCEIEEYGSDTIRGIYGQPADCGNLVRKMLRPDYLGPNKEILVYGEACERIDIEAPGERESAAKAKRAAGIKLSEEEEKEEAEARKARQDRLFEQAVTCLIEREGGYSDDDKDLGGKTNFGISTPLHEELKKSSNPELRKIGEKDLKNELKREDAETVYRAKYWREDLSGAVAFVYLFASVHCGEAWANTTLSNICSTFSCRTSEIPDKDNDAIAFAFTCALAAYYEELYYRNPSGFNNFQLGFGQRAAYICAKTFPERASGFLYMKPELLAPQAEK